MIAGVAQTQVQVFDKTAANVVIALAGGSRQLVRKVTSGAACGPQGGWYYDDETNPRSIVTCDATCQIAQSDPAAALELELGCPTIHGG